MRLFPSEKYEQRRASLAGQVKSGLIWIMGNGESAANYKDNTFPFRQNSNFLYYFGLNAPELHATIDAETGEAILYGHELTMDDIIWMGEIEKLSELGLKIGVTNVKHPEKLFNDLEQAKSSGREIHFLPPYRLEHYNDLSKAGLDKPSEVLIKAVIKQRSIKDSDEIKEMSQAVDITRQMHLAAYKHTKPGKYEYEVVAEITRECRRFHADFSYGPIFSVNGQVLHNHHHDNLMTSGRLALNDSGAHNDMLYAGDITRTFPVSGTFTSKQKEIYQIVLEMEKAGITLSGPGVYYRDVHVATNKIMLERFIELGILKGNVDDMIEQGVNGMFMPHGLGHMIGLDVHDMEDLGENMVGYEPGQDRSKMLGLKSLRLARRLEPGFTFTVEPGIYFIPQLIEKFKSDNMYHDFVNYSLLQSYYDFGGIRIEDNVYITQEGREVLGTYIPKEIEEIEHLMAD
jgi:Xaa-Pro aminopeptidase